MQTTLYRVSVFSIRVIIVISIIYMISMVLSWQKVHAQSQDADVYESLKSGNRLLQDRTYTKPKNPTVYLTFDDGPSHLTPQVLDILKKENVKATFFALGSQAEARPEILRRIVEEGHSLGNHTYNHKYDELYSSFANFWDQLKKTDDAFYRIAGVRTNLVRAPGGTYGKFDAFYFYYLDRAGYRVHDWNLDSGDSRYVGVPAKDIIAAVKKGPFPHELNVLLHDGTGHAESVKALPEIIRFLKEKGYEFAPITDQVKPIMFTLGQGKYHRHLDRTQFVSTLNLVSQDASRQAPSETKQVPLVVKTDVQSFVLTGDRYEIRDDKLFVPLRTLVEHMGGSVNWNEALQTAQVTIGRTRADFQTDLKRVSIFNGVSGGIMQYFGDMELKRGTLMVPLRETVGQLSLSIESYTAHSNQKEVTIGSLSFRDYYYSANSLFRRRYIF